MIESLIEIFQRDLQALKKELHSYENERNLWIVKDEIKNAGGNLALHLIGNLKHFIGAILGESGYKRDRAFEFAGKDVPVAQLYAEIDETSLAVEDALHKLTPEDLSKVYPIEVFSKPMTTQFFLLHLATHLSYHLGQINYHRRLLDN